MTHTEAALIDIALGRSRSSAARQVRAMRKAVVIRDLLRTTKSRRCKVKDAPLLEGRG